MQTSLCVGVIQREKLLVYAKETPLALLTYCQLSSAGEMRSEESFANKSGCILKAIDPFQFVNIVNKFDQNKP